VRSRQRRSQALDAEHRDVPAPATDSDADPEAAEAPTSLAEAEEEATRAALRAEEARARAMELRRQAEAASGDQPNLTDDAGTADDDDDEPEPPSSRWRRWRPRWVHRPTRKTVRVAAATVLVSASLAATGYVAWQHFTLVRERRHAAEFAAAARQGVTTMMSIDPDHAKDDVQRMIDDTTGALQSQLRVTSTYLVKDAQDAKVATKATVEDVAVESMTDNSAVVLVAARSETTNPDKTKRPPAVWRLSVNVDRDGGQLKMSKMDFVQ
jgi:Mce-associated membrane protein